MITHTESWYTIQASRQGADDWNETSDRTYDSLRGARQALATERHQGAWRGFEFRIVKKTLSEEPMPARHLQPAAGQCPECGHWGSDCTGAKTEAKK
jgi:hypothetical protein